MNEDSKDFKLKIKHIERALCSEDMTLAQKQQKLNDIKEIIEEYDEYLYDRIIRHELTERIRFLLANLNDKTVQLTHTASGPANSNNDSEYKEFKKLLLKIERAVEEWRNKKYFINVEKDVRNLEGIIGRIRFLLKSHDTEQQQAKLEKINQLIEKKYPDLYESRQEREVEISIAVLSVHLELFADQLKSSTIKDDSHTFADILHDIDEEVQPTDVPWTNTLSFVKKPLLKSIIIVALLLGIGYFLWYAFHNIFAMGIYSLLCLIVIARVAIQPTYVNRQEDSPASKKHISDDFLKSLKSGAMIVVDGTMLFSRNIFDIHSVNFTYSGMSDKGIISLDGKGMVDELILIAQSDEGLRIDTPTPLKNIEEDSEKLIDIFPHEFEGSIDFDIEEVYVLVRGGAKNNYAIFVLGEVENSSKLERKGMSLSQWEEDIQWDEERETFYYHVLELVGKLEEGTSINTIKAALYKDK